MCHKSFSITSFVLNPPLLLTLIENSKTLKQLKQVHAKTISFGNLYSQSLLSKLIRSFSTDLDLDYAARLFDRTDFLDIFIWNSLIRSYSCSETPLNAILVYNRLRVSGIVGVDNYTFPFVFRACANVCDKEKGKEVHGLVVRNGFDLDRFVRNSLLSFYSVCGEMGDARRVFDETLEKDVVFWNAMILGYARVGGVFGAFDVFMEMLELGELEPNEGTLLGLISACSVARDVELGRRIHGYATKNIGCYGGLKVGAALVDLYAKCGCMSDARKVFSEMGEQNIVAWNSLISGYSQNGCPREAVDAFREMHALDIKPDKFTVSVVLSACAQMGALSLGCWVQQFAERNKIWDVFVGTTLIDMYAKCGLMSKALEVFRSMPQKSVATWNAILSGFASHGKGQYTLELFSEMEKSGVKPDSITFVAVLSACTHAGLVKEGRQYFRLMVEYYKLLPKVEHYGCMVDLLGRARLLNEAKKLVESMDIEPSVVVWGALLSACSVHGDVEIGEWAAHHVFRLDPMDAGSYVLMSNMYATTKRFDRVREVREMMALRGVRKPPGCSMIEVRDVVHEFVVADKTHSRSEEIYSMLDGLYRGLKREGYVPMFELDEES